MVTQELGSEGCLDESPQGDAVLMEGQKRYLEGGAREPGVDIASVEANRRASGREKIERSKVRLAIIDSRPLTRESVVHLIHKNARDFLALPFSSPEELGACEGNSGVDLILLSVGSARMPEADVCRDLMTLEQITPDVAVAILSDCEEPDCIAEALRRGLRGYIPTSLSAHVVIGALRLIRVGGTFIPASVITNAVKAKPADEPQSSPQARDAKVIQNRFTARQLEVLSRLREGKSNKLIAYELSMQESTVKVHVRHIMRKLNATNRTQADYLAQQLSTA